MQPAVGEHRAFRCAGERRRDPAHGRYRPAERGRLAADLRGQRRRGVQPVSADDGPVPSPAGRGDRHRRLRCRAHAAYRHERLWRLRKAALKSLALTVGLELAGSGVRCNLVSPGSTDADMQRTLWVSDDAEQQRIRGFGEQFKLGIPLGKIARPQEIANTILFLASSHASHITCRISWLMAARRWGRKWPGSEAYAGGAERQQRKYTMVAHLGIIYTRLEEGLLEAEMPVDARTHQPFGLLHGGALGGAGGRRWARWPVG